MVVLEAWARGRPVIAHAVGALPEIIDHGRTGLLADPQVPGSLASALDTAFTSADLQRMGDEGFEELLSRYNKSLWSAKINKVYSSLGR